MKDHKDERQAAKGWISYFYAAHREAGEGRIRSWIRAVAEAARILR